MFQATQIGYQLKLVFSQTSATFSLTATEIDFGTMEERDIESLEIKPIEIISNVSTF
jgi:hypothetical protein